jgi:hypothetical protein
VEGFMGRQSGNIFRTTISVPVDLKERMDAVKDQVNWSAIAVRAFEQKLAEIASRKKKKTMDDMIQRLRGWIIQRQNEDYQAGHEDSQEWGKHSAGVRDLERVEKLVLDVNRIYEGGLGQFLRECAALAGVAGAYTVGERVYFQMFPEHQDDHTAAASFWEAALGNDSGKTENPDFVRGFIEGAKELWDTVKDRL